MEITVVPELDIAQQVPANGIGAASLQQQFWIQHVAEGFPHLLPLAGEKAMAENLLRYRQTRRHAHGRPEDGMKAENVLANHVDGSGPTAGAESIERHRFSVIEKCGQIAKKCIKPDVEGVAGMIGHGQPPGHIHSGNGEVTQTLGDKISNLLTSAGGSDEVVPSH